MVKINKVLRGIGMIIFISEQCLGTYKFAWGDIFMRYTRLGLITSLLITIFLGYSSPVQGDGGVEESSYIVFRSAPRTYAKNGTSGMIEFSSTDAATVIQSAINNGKLIHIKEGTYELATSIVITEGNKKITGVGRWTTILKLANGINQDVIKGNGTVLQGLSFSNFGIDGNKINNTLGNGLNLTGMAGAVVENVEIGSVARYGIYADGIIANSDNIMLYTVTVGGSGLDGYRFKDCYGIRAFGMFTNANLGNGIVFEGGGDANLYRVAPDGETHVGLLLDNVRRMNVIGGYANSQEEALRIQGNSSYVNVIAFPPFMQGDAGIPVAVIRVKDTASNIKIINCSPGYSNKKGFSLENTVDYVLVEGNDFTDNIGGAVTNTSTGTHNKFRRNFGYVTENGGIASVKNGDTIAHGLAEIPTFVRLTASANRRRIACTAKDNTNITIGLWDNSGTPITTPENVYWYAEY